MAMTKRERVMAALSGQPVDRVPLALWLHNFATESSAEGLAGETLRLARTFDCSDGSINPDTPEPLLHAAGAVVSGRPRS